MEPDPLITSGLRDINDAPIHNHWDASCAERAVLAEAGENVIRTVQGARCWICRPHRSGELAPPRHADEEAEELALRPAVKILGVDPGMPQASVDGWEAFIESHGVVDVARLERVGRDLLEAIGEDPDREGLRDTPARWARMWAEFIDYEPGTISTVFDGVTSSQLVVVRGVTVWSLCEHHLVPFKATLTMGYLTDNKVVGLSKLARIAHQYAHRLQLQERLVTQIGQAISEVAETPNVAVIGAGSHLCMEMRGVRTPGEMLTSHLGGRFEERDLRAEFLALHHG